MSYLICLVKTTALFFWLETWSTRKKSKLLPLPRWERENTSPLVFKLLRFNWKIKSPKRVSSLLRLITYISGSLRPFRFFLWGFARIRPGVVLLPAGICTSEFLCMFRGFSMCRCRWAGPSGLVSSLICREGRWLFRLLLLWTICLRRMVLFLFRHIVGFCGEFVVTGDSFFRVLVCLVLLSDAGVEVFFQGCFSLLQFFLCYSGISELREFSEDTPGGGKDLHILRWKSRPGGDGQVMW